MRDKLVNLYIYVSQMSWFLLSPMLCVHSGFGVFQHLILSGNQAEIVQSPVAIIHVIAFLIQNHQVTFFLWMGFMDPTLTAPVILSVQSSSGRTMLT